ncbi:MAG: tetratricopeptide (TPR) repeat protein [Planctomycetota bacterium]
MNGLLVCAVSLFLQAPQAPETGVFTKMVLPSKDGELPRTVVSADKRQINCRTALNDLCTSMNWNLVFESTPLDNELRLASIDLNLAEQAPRMVAQLLAVAGGADTIFDEPAAFEGARVTLHVVRTPSGETESGRQRLRALAGQWYRSFLQDDLKYEAVVQQEGMHVRMHLGQLLLDSGDLESAILFFSDVYENRPHDHVAQAVLKIAESHIDLARGHIDNELKLKQLAEAEKWVRRIFEGFPTSPATTPATLLLGRVLLAQAQAQSDPVAVHAMARKCQDELRARIIHLLDSVELLEVWLLSGHAQFLMERPQRCYETMQSLRESPYFDDLGPEQFLDYHFLLGYGALGSDKPELAMRALEWFLIHAENDDRRGRAYVLMAESYFEQQLFLEGRAASIEAREHHLAGMPSDWRQRTLRIWARTALALGEKESAFVELEQMVLRGEEPELSLFLIDQMLDDHQWQRAMTVASVLIDRDDHIGDQARFKTVKALYAQAVAGDHMNEFPSLAIAIAPKVSDPGLREQISTMIGEAYTTLNKLEHAADAFRGILR